MAKLTYGGTEASPDNVAVNSRWYREEKDVHSLIFGYIKHLNQTQTDRADELFKSARMYGSLPGLDIATRTSVANDAAKLPKLTLNVVKSAIDTVHSKMSKNQPKPTFLTDGGNWLQQSKAKKLNKFIAGQFYESNVYRHGAIALQHSLIFGTGCVKVWREGSDIKVEPVLAEEVFVDKFDGMYGEPQQMHQVKYIHRDVLVEVFPKFKTAIEQSKPGNITSSIVKSEDNPDMICVVESWKLAVGETAGRHTITIENATLLDEEYRLCEFPIRTLVWRRMPLGFWGQGVPEEIKGIQVEINKLLQTIQMTMHLTSVPKLLVDAGSKVSLKSLDNRIGGIIRYSGTLPTPMQMGHVPVELFTHLEWLYQKAWEILGISQLSGASMKPAGLDSGKALREFNDIESERFLAFGREYENFYMDIAKFMLKLVEDMENDEGTEDYQVRTHNGKEMEFIKWSDVKMDEEEYIMQMFPSSALSSTPAARMAEVNDLINMGFLDRTQALKLLDFPDITAMREYELAAEQDIDKVIAEIVENANYLPPEPYQDLQNGVIRMQQAYLVYRTKNLPEERLEMIRMWVTTANAMLEQAAVEARQQEMMQAAMSAPVEPVAPEASAPAKLPIA